MTIDEAIRNNTAINDFEAFKKFFELMGIKYEIPAYKRFLKLAVEDFTVYGALKDLPTEQRVQNPDWQRFNRVFDILDHRWRYTDEALKLLGKDEGNEHK